MKPSSVLQKAHKAALFIENRLIEAVRQRTAATQLARFSRPYRLNLGCGSAKFEDPWINIDIDHGADVRWNLTSPLPIEDSSCLLIYSEHVLEHFSPEQGAALLSECYRLLIPGGVLRIAMPSLEQVARKYLSAEWREQEWLGWPGYESIETPAEMLNIALRAWGHQWVYDSTELFRRLRDAGFSSFRTVDFRQSDEAQLRNRETRRDSLLICEAIR